MRIAVRNTLSVIFIFFSTLVVADFDKGMTAYNSSDYATAIKEFSVAAEQGHAKAQYNLGTMYAKGEGVPENYIKAYMWVSLAAAFGYKDEKKAKEVLKKRMSSEQIAEAQRLSSEWFEKYSQKNQN